MINETYELAEDKVNFNSTYGYYYSYVSYGLVFLILVMIGLKKLLWLNIYMEEEDEKIKRNILFSICIITRITIAAISAIV